MAAMSISVSDGPAIVAGYEYRLQLEADSPVFPAGCTLAAQVRTKVSDSAVITTLTTGNGGLARISDTIVEITIPAAATANLPPGSIVMDMVRTDLDPDQHLNFTLEIPVIRPVTRGL
jgi:hypothetical protein